MFFLSRKQLFLTAVLSLATEIIVTTGLLLATYMGWLDNMNLNIIMLGFFPIISLITGWLSRHWTGNWFVALLVPLLVFTSFILVSISSLLFLAYVPLYMAISLGGYYLFGFVVKKRH